MVLPSEVKIQAGKLEKSNYKFRAFLKNHADEDELDSQFLALHKELFENYDCTGCRNCCKEYNPVLKEDEVGPVAALLQITRDDFLKQYKIESDYDCYELKGIPCCFLNADNTCRIEACKPQNCKDYPYTDKPERIWSLLGVIEAASICPVVFEIVERLKKLYKFKMQ